jgi:hypothetical protein
MDTTTTISADVLNQDPKPFELNMGTGVPSTSSYIDELTKNMASLQEKGAGFESAFTSLLSQPGAEQYGQDLGESVGLNDANKRLGDVTNQLAGLDAQNIGLQGNARKEALGTLETGQFLSAKQRNINDEISIQKAPLLYEQAVISGNVQAAQSFIEGLVKVKAEQDKAKLDIAKTNLERNYDLFDSADKKLADAKLKEIDNAQKANEKRQELSLELTKNGAPASIISQVVSKNNIDEVLTIPGIEKYMQSPLERAQLAKIWADINEMKNIASPGLSTEDRKNLLKDTTAKQASARIGVIKAIEDYKKKVIEYKGGKAFDWNRLTSAEKKELQTALNTTVGSAINVAQGQGAMGDAEAQRILGNLDVKRRIRSSVIQAAADGAVGAQKSLLDNDLSFIESSYPGATDSYQLFADYKREAMPDEEFFSSSLNASVLSPDVYFNSI